MMLYYLQLTPILRFVIWSLISLAILTKNYWPRFVYAKQILAANQVKAKQLQQQLTEQLTIINNQQKYLAALKEINLLSIDTAFEAIAHLAQKSHLPEPHWQKLQQNQYKFSMQGELKQLSLYWQLLANNYIPQQIIHFDLKPSQDNDQILQCNVYFSTQNSPQELPANSDQMPQNPFSKLHQAYSMANLDPKSLKWLGALQINNIYYAYAVLPNNTIQRYQIGDSIGKDNWKITAINLNQINLQNTLQQLLIIPFKTLISRDTA